MSHETATFSAFVSLSGIEYPEEIDLGLVGCYVYHQGELLDVLVLSDSEQKLRMKNLTPDDSLRFECKLLGTNQRFLGSVSIIAEKLLAISPGEDWSQLFPLFDEGEQDEFQRDFGDIKVVPPCILLTFHPTDLETVVTSSQIETVTKTQTVSRSSGAKNSTRKSKNSSVKKGSKKSPKAKSAPMTLEELVIQKIEELGEDMNQIQQDDRQVIDRLEVLAAHHEGLDQRHPFENDKRDQAAVDLDNLMAIVGEDSTEQDSNDNDNITMKQQDRVDVDELAQSKSQLNEDVGAASSDLEILLKDTKDLNDFISDKSGQSYDTQNTSVPNKQKAIRAFLLQTLNNSDEGQIPIYNENKVLKGKANELRQLVKDKFMNAESMSDDEINNMCQDYEELLAKHGDIFKQLDDEASQQVDEFGRNGDLWKQLFTEGMNLEKKCDDVEYDIEDLADQEARLKLERDDIDNTYGDYVGKIRYVNEQQKGMIDELRGQITASKTDINDLRRQHDNAAADLAVESKSYARGRNTQDDPNLINLTNDIVGVHQERRRAQDDVEGLTEDWVATHKEFHDRSYSGYKAAQKDRNTVTRMQDVVEQISISNQDIESLLSEMSRIEREKSIAGHRSAVSFDMTSDLADLRSRLDSELSKRERIIVELKDYASLQRTKVGIYSRQREEIDNLVRDIKELREFLRGRYEDEKSELLELQREIEAHKERLRAVIDDINEVRFLIIEEEHHNEIKRNLLRNRDEYIERLKISMKGLKVKKPAPAKEVVYIVTPGDDIDIIIAEKMREFGVNIPLTRLGGGFYLFGTKKICAKIMNEKLVVRVGGGYMVIDEFLATYSDMELIRINKMMENECVEAYEELKVYIKYKGENPEAFKKQDMIKRTMIRSQKEKMNVSDRGKF